MNKLKVLFLLAIILYFIGYIFPISLNYFSWCLIVSDDLNSNFNFINNTIVNILTYALSFIIVGLIFNILNLFNKNLVKLFYLIVSYGVSVGLIWILKLLKEFWWTSLIVLLIIFIILIIKYIKNNGESYD